VVLFRFSEGKRLLIEKVQEEYPVNDYILSIFLNAENNMKKLYFVAVAVLLLSSFSFGEVVGDTESMAPGDKYFCKNQAYREAAEERKLYCISYNG